MDPLPTINGTRPHLNLQTALNAMSPVDLHQAFTNLQVPQDSNWYMDTGAAAHLTANPGKITTPMTFSSNTIFVGNGHRLPISGSGNSLLPILNKTYRLLNIQHAPTIIKDLLSVRQFTRDNHVSIEFDPYGFSLKDLKTGTHLSRHNSTGDLYPFSPPTQALSTSSSAPLWHNRLGHPGANILDFLSRHAIIDCNKTSNSFVCPLCQLANSKRLPFSESNSITFAPFDLIHCDLWTSPVLSNYGYKYYMVLIDNFSQYVWIYPLKYKSETFSTFAKFHKLETPRGEFDNNNFKTFAQTHGLIMRFSCPQTSPQNGKAERMIRRLNDIIRSVLIHAHMPPTFWVEALHTATYLHNILPSKRLRYTTPAYILFHRHPTYDHLRVFGCACYPNTSATQPHKLHPRSIRCIFLGYPPGYRGYRCLDPNTGRVHISRHVTFDEHTFPFNHPSTPTTYTFLDEDPSPFPSPQLYPTVPILQTTQPDPPLTQPSGPQPPTSPLPKSTPAQSDSPVHPASPIQPIVPAATSITHPPPPLNTHSMTTRAKQGVFKPNPKYSLSTTHTSNNISPVPTSYLKALSDPNWLRAMNSEFSALQENHTWDLVPRPSDSPVIRCMWLFRHKFKSDGTLERYKARLVVNGKSQTVGIDCHDTFSLVVKPATIRTVLSLDVSKQWPIHQLDVKNAFLHGHLEETVYMHQPPGFVNANALSHVCRLRKSLYGLKQAPRAWYTRFSTFLLSRGFRNSICDTSLFIYRQGGRM
ncbi:hypothetical protein OSB04_027639 [Centaurea solstitialis]|uniref:Integrase catalytic domain-containing protein n=1 Tax=Centaurea solstitialis TaxID=347529 RepID=A0AA38SZ55_9ASTR|nr:hypothetical protein OSB04_027639 [Centaurea solstitialis]